MTPTELTQAISEITDRFEVDDAVLGDLRSALRDFEYDPALKAIREVSLGSDYKRLPTGKLMKRLKEMNPNAGRPLGKKSIMWDDIFLFNRTTGGFHNLCTGGNCDRDMAMRAAESMRQKAVETEGGEWITITGTLAELRSMRTKIYMKG